MEWYIMNADGLNSMAQDICCYLDGELVISDECKEILVEIEEIIQRDDPMQHPIQRHFGCCGLIQKSLVPLLIHCEEKEIIHLCLKLISQLTQPVDCFEVTSVPQQVAAEMNTHISQVRELFSEGIALLQLSRHMMLILKQTGDGMMNADDVATTNDIIVIIRNMLYEVEGGRTSHQKKIKEAMVHNGMYNVLLTLLASRQQERWCVHLVQLISLIFKDEIVCPSVMLGGTEDSSSTPYSMDVTDYDSTEMITDSCEISSSNSGNSYYNSYFCQCMERFVKAFLVEGFGPLVRNLQNILRSADNVDLSDYYYMWCVGHFISFCKPNLVPMHILQEVLSTDVFSFLIFKGVESCEQIVMATKNKMAVNQLVRKNYLVVKALQELLQAVQLYRTANPSDEHIAKLLNDLVGMRDLRQLFLLLIRNYDSAFQHLYFLKDTVWTNHMLLVLLEEFSCDSEEGNLDMLRHVTQFGTRHMMAQYTLVLEAFKENTDCVNEAVFTMMHHVAGDCGQHESLLQYPVIKTFLEIGDDHRQLPEEYFDLMDFVFNNMTQLAESNPEKCAEKMLALKSSGADDEEEDARVGLWSQEELSELFCLYSEHQDSPTVAADIVKDLDDLGITKKQAQVVQQLFLSGLVHEDAMKDILAKEEDGKAILQSLMRKQPIALPDNIEEATRYCVKVLTENQQVDSLIWLQGCLLDACEAKLDNQGTDVRPPVAHNYTLLDKSIPLVPYSEAQVKILKDSHFKILIHTLGFHMAEDTGFLFHRIPHHWTSLDLLSKAQQIGPVHFENLAFSEEEVNQPPMVTSTKDLSVKATGDADKSALVPESLWIMLVQKCNIYQQQMAQSTRGATPQPISTVNTG